MNFFGKVSNDFRSQVSVFLGGVIPIVVNMCDTKLPTNGPLVVSVGDKPMYLAILCDLFGMVK